MSSSQNGRSKTGGAGLGLAIADNIIKLHGGKIEIRSKDGMTVFDIWITDN